MNRKVVNNDSLQTQLHDVGYLKMPLLAAQEANAILDFIKTLRPDDEFNPKGNQHGNPSTYHCSYLDTNIEYKRKVSSFQKTITQLLYPTKN